VKYRQEGGAHSVFLRVSLQREFAHQLGPAIGIVGVVRALGEVFREIDLFLCVRLQKIWIHAAGRSKHHFFYFGFERFGKDQTVQEKVRRWARLVEIHVTAAAMIRGEMENVSTPCIAARVTPGSLNRLGEIDFARPRCGRMLPRWPLLKSSTMPNLFAPRASN